MKRVEEWHRQDKDMIEQAKQGVFIKDKNRLNYAIRANNRQSDMYMFLDEGSAVVMKQPSAPVEEWEQ